MTNNNQHIPSGYKPSPLGIIPKDWEVKRLGELGNFSKGNGVPKDKIIKDANEHPCLTYGDLYTKYDFVIKDIKSFIDDDVASESKEIHIGDICFAGSGETPEDIGKCAAYIEERTAYAGGDIIILAPNKDINSIWLSYALNSDIGGKQRYKFAQGFSIVHIYPDYLKQIQIPTPTFTEQNSIVSVLSLWDTAISKQTALIEKLTLRKRGLMQKLLTGKKRLKGFEGEWKTKELGDALSYIQPTKYLVVSENYNNTYKTPVLTAGKTFILGYTDETTGVFNDLPAIIFDDFTTESKYVTFPFKAKSSAMKILKAHNSNLYFMFCAMQMIKYSIGGHERHWISKFSHITLKVPSLEEQNAIASVLVNADKEIEIAKNKLSHLQEQKRGLMQVLLTGKKRLK